MLAVLGSLLEVWVIPGLTGGSFMEEQNDIHKKPSPIQCGVEKEEELTTRRPDVRFCEWDSTLRSCREMLMRYVYKQPSWVFLGDTGMAKVADYISQKWPFDPYNDIVSKFLSESGVLRFATSKSGMDRTECHPG